MPSKVKQPIHTFYNHPSDFSMKLDRAIPYGVNYLKNIHINHEFSDEFFATFYNDKNMLVHNIFGKLTKPFLNGISHPALLK